MVDTFARTSLDALYMALGGFAETKQHPRDLWKQRLRKLWAQPITTEQIGERLGITGRTVCVHAHLMNLPARINCKRRRQA